MTNRIIEHVPPCSNEQRIYDMLKRMDRYMIPILSERVDLKEYAAKLDARADLYYIRYDNRDCGHCAVYQNHMSKAYISSFGILPEYQRKGFASCLLEHVLDEIKRIGIIQVGLEVHETNRIAYKLYYDMGFREVGRENDFIKLKRDGRKEKN